MKKIFITLFLICLITGQEVQVLDTKLKDKEIMEEEEPVLKEAITITTILVTAAIGATVTFILNKVYDKIYYHMTNSNTIDTYNENGNGRWLSNIKDGYVMSAYYHKTKTHTATCDGGLLGGGQIRAKADPGQWAIALCKAGISGRKTYWNTL